MSKKICPECGYHKHDKPKLDEQDVHICPKCGIFYTIKAQVNKKKGGFR